MEEWEYIVGVKHNIRDIQGIPGSSCHFAKEVIKFHTPTEAWLNEKGREGRELVTALTQDSYTVFFMKRKQKSREER